MIYKNKKDPKIKAQFDFEDLKFKTVRMIYLSGPNKGKSFSLNKTSLNDQWEVVEEKEKKSFLDTINWDEVNKPYPEPKVKKYIPVPESVLRYEQGKIKKKKCSFEKPENYEAFADILASHNIKMARVNTGYISLPDTTKLKLQQLGIAVLATNDLGEKLVGKGMTCKPCIEKGTPFRFDIRSQDEFDDLIEVLKNVSY